MARGLQWAEDPSNAKLVSHRNTVRAALADMYVFCLHEAHRETM